VEEIPEIGRNEKELSSPHAKEWKLATDSWYNVDFA
jgi:hypothetical protein